MPFWETNLNGVWNDKWVLLGQGQVEQAQELAQRGLIHHVHHAHLRDQKVQNASSCGNYTQKRWCQQRPCLHLVLTSIWDTTRHGPFVSEPRKSLILWLIASGSDCMIKISKFSSNFEFLQRFLIAQHSEILDSDWSFMLGLCHEVLRGSAAIKIQTFMTMLLKNDWDEQGQCQF